MSGFALGIVLGPFVSALLLTIRWAGRTLLNRPHKEQR